MDSSDTPRIAKPVLRESDPPSSKGGASTHKNPACRCYPCTARRRKTEALTLTIGGGGGDLDPRPEEPKNEVLNADQPMRTEKRTHRSRIAEWIRMRALEPGITNIEVARRMGIAPQTLNSYIYLANKSGWLKFDDPFLKIEYEIIPQTVKNLQKFLNEEDKTVTIETAKGTIFKTYQESKGINQAPTTILALKLETPEGGDQLVSGRIVGKPKVTVEEVEE